MASQFIQGQIDSATTMKARSEQVKAILDYCWSLRDSDLPPLEMMNVIGSYDTHHFKQNMVQFFSEFYWRSLLREDSHVIDLGCGCGRLAIPISAFVTSGAYHGVDVWRGGIEWCQNNIKTKNARSQFVLASANNNYYFEDRDACVRNEFGVPFAKTGTIDFAFAISLFSHLTFDDALSYLSDVSRALKESGVIYITGFVIDQFFEYYREQTGSHRQLREEASGCFYAYQGQDFFAGFTLPTWQRIFDKAGLEILSFELGSWAKKPGARPYQDTFVLAKRTANSKYKHYIKAEAS